MAEDVNTPEVRKVGRYEIVRELGRGGMGVVYEATDPKIRRSVAIKVLNLRGREEPGRERHLKKLLLREARAAGVLSHPGIVTVYDVDEEGEMPFIVMERVKGLTLEEVLRSNSKLPVARSLDILTQTAVALDYAHANGVVHRDIKPSNIMLENGKTVKVADFGIARQLFALTQTTEGALAGTPQYMSPEQCETRAVDGKSDQFSLATVACEMLTGTNPFYAGSGPAIYHKLAVAQRPSATALNPALPHGVDDVLKRAWSKPVEQRYARCVDFVAALRSAATGERAPEPGTTTMTVTLTGETTVRTHLPPKLPLPARVFRKAIGKKCARAPSECPQAGVLKDTSAHFCESCSSELVLATKWNWGAVVVCALLLAVPAGAVGYRALRRNPATTTESLMAPGSATAIQYALQTGDPDSPVIVSPDHVFHSGDSFRLLVKSEAPAYLYVYHEDPSGGRLDRLFPSGAQPPQLFPGGIESIPGDEHWIRLNGQPAAEHFVIVAAPMPRDDLRAISSRDELNRRFGEAAKFTPDNLWSEARGAKDNVILADVTVQYR